MGEANNGIKRDPNCIFCRIIAREIPAKFVFEDESAVAIRDINPQAPTHVLIIPKDHVANLLEAKDHAFLGAMMAKASDVVKHDELDSGFRVVVNTGNDGGQTVHHLHIHVLGGRAMHWPPG
ncbi:MAG TPA: histidine triad nucleotide-binding protein [Candidatus Obscuribacterales bacterium]